MSEAAVSAVSTWTRGGLLAAASVCLCVIFYFATPIPIYALVFYTTGAVPEEVTAYLQPSGWLYEQWPAYASYLDSQFRFFFK